MEKIVLAGCAVALAGLLVACGDDSDTSAENTHTAMLEPAAGEDMVGAAPGVTATNVGPLAGVASGTYPVVASSASDNGVAAVPAALRGKWAANANSCNGGWWRIGDMDAETARGVKCALNGIENAAGGGISTTLVLTCEGEGMTANERWEVSQPQGGQLMLLRRAEEVVGSGDYKDQGAVMPLMECPATAT